MLNIGNYSKLKILRRTENGLYLSDGDDEVLLPKRYVPETLPEDGILKVFIALDSDDRPVCVTGDVPLTLGGYAPLTVKQLTKIGAFLDWGLPKDLLLPFAEMTERPNEGDTILVRLYLDKSSRLSASMRGLYHLLLSDSPYNRSDTVTARIYEFGSDASFGVFCAVDDKYSAMLPRFERTPDMKIGDIISAKVSNKKADGKLDLTMREKAHIQMEEDEEALLLLIDEFGGVLPFTEKAKPEVIQRETGLSKGAFKRAVGGLYKKRLITLENGVIRKVSEK